MMHENGSEPQKTAGSGVKPDTMGRRNRSPHPVAPLIPPMVPRALMPPSINPSHPPYPQQIPAKDQTVKPSETSGTDTKSLNHKSSP